MPLSREILIPTAIALVSAVAGLVLYKGMATEPVPQVAITSSKPSSQADVVGTTASDIKLNTPEGHPSALSDWSGKPLVVNFWATWCPPCREEIPDLMELQKQYKDEGLVVVGIALDDVAKVDQFVKEFGINYPILVEPGRGTQMNAAFGNAIGALPYTVFIDDASVIRAVHRGALTRLQGQKTIEAYLLSK